MGSTGFHKVVFTIGICFLVHTAVSAAQHRTYLRLTEQEFTSLSLDIVVQGILSLIACMYGIIYIAGDLKEIKATEELENKSWETLRNIPSYYIFSHRGRSLSPAYDPTSVGKSMIDE
uniref:Membrane magnesium transporter n=1 Tax=Cacopsylla melanoneura TaxID=428564 RepID=A0A8D8UV28_9HEMI